MRVSVREIPSGVAGTDATVAEMNRLVQEGLRSGQVRFTALEIIEQAGIEARDWAGEIQAVFDWVTENIRYTKDPYELETVHSPDAILELRAGDCDDQSIILAALLQSLGHKTRFKVIASRNARVFNHVYVEVYLDGEWIPLDATNPTPLVGWESPVILNSKTYEGGKMYQDEIEGLGAARPGGPAERSPSKQVLVIPGEAMIPHVTATLRADMKALLEKRAVSRDELLTQLNYLTSAQAQTELSPVQIQPAIRVLSEAIRVIEQTPGYRQEITVAGLAGLDDLGWNLFKAIKKAVGKALPLAASFIPGVGPLISGAISMAQKPKAPGAAAAPVAAAPTIVISNPPNSPAGAPQVTMQPTSGPGGITKILSNPLYIGLAAAAVMGIFIVPKLLAGSPRR